MEPEEARPRNYHMPRRNKHLTYRFYYYSNILFLRYEKCLEKLEQEFYLCEERIVVLLNNDVELLEKIAREKLTTKDLQKEIPHLNW